MFLYCAFFCQTFFLIIEIKICKMSTLVGVTNIWMCFEIVNKKEKKPCMFASHKTGRTCHRQECKTKDFAVKAFLTFALL